jgi:ABC-2 type transport system permease protein
VLLLVGVAGDVATGADLTRPQTAIHAVSYAGVVSLITLIFGTTAVAGEYRHNTITDTYLASPRRGRVIAAKFAVYTTAGAVFGVMLAMTAVIATAVVITPAGGSLDLSNSDLWRTLAGGIACNAAFAAIGVSLGALITNLAVAIAAALAWIALVEGLIGELIGDLEAWLPFAAGQALGRMPGAPDTPQWAGGLLLAGLRRRFRRASPDDLCAARHHLMEWQSETTPTGLIHGS